MKKVFIHNTATIDKNVKIGEGTKIWHQVHIREGAKIGKNCILGKNVYVNINVKIGDNVRIQNNVCVYDSIIEDDVFIGPGTVFTNDLYPRAVIWDPNTAKPIVIKKGASIGANSTLICGLTIGKYAMVGAGSVVTKDIPDYSLVFGNPARLKRFVCKCGHKLSELKKEAIFVLMQCSDCKKEIKIPQNDYQKLTK